MARITSIKAFVQTGTASGAGTDAYVYLGIGGREFVLDASGNDFETGSKFTYVLGAGSNVENGDLNNPVNPQLYTEWLSQYPVYLRMDGSGSSPDWEVAKVTASVYIAGADNVAAATYTCPLVDGNDSTVWLGVDYGMRLELAAAVGPMSEGDAEA